MAWDILESSTPVKGKPPGYAESGRPANYVELGQMVEDTGDFEHCRSEFLHGFYAHKTADFFAHPPTNTFSTEYQAYLAAAAEALCLRFRLPVPPWTQEPGYTLPEPWDPVGYMYPDVPLTSRIAASSPIFLKHNVLFPERGLIAL